MQIVVSYRTECYSVDSTIWMSEWNDFNSYELPCRSDTSKQVSVQIVLRFGKGCGLKKFKIAAVVASKSPTKFQLNSTSGGQLSKI